MAGLQFDNKITSGNLLTIGAVVATVVAGWTNLQAVQVQQGRQLEALELEVTATTAQTESRVRSLEIQQAGQSSDLRNIQVGINEIKAALDRLSDQRGLK